MISSSTAPRHVAAIVLAGILVVAGCKKEKQPPPPEAAGSAPSPVTSEAPAASAVPESGTSESATPAPDGYVPAHVLRVVLSADGGAVLLQSEIDGRVLPIFVGGTEALSIGLRHESRRYQRPLTHDLLDSVADQLGGKLLKVHVEGLARNIFIGRVFYRHGDRDFDVDARPSDAIALALGNQVPIFVATKVLDQAAVRPEDLTPDQDEVPDPRVGRPDEPMQL